MLTAIHPGEHLAEELEALDMSAAELARKLDVPTNRRVPHPFTVSVKGAGFTFLRLCAYSSSRQHGMFGSILPRVMSHYYGA